MSLERAEGGERETSAFLGPEVFEEKLAALLASKKKLDTSFYITRAKYDEFLRDTKAAEEKESGLTSLDGHRLDRFAVVKFPGQPEKLVDGTKRKKGQPPPPPQAKPIFFVAVDELHDVLRQAHNNIGHGGKHRMVAELKGKYKNATEEVILLYLSLCPTCITKRNPVRRGNTVCPMVFLQMNGRMQVDLVDMQ
ncbi:KRAB-A domain-containing protein 2-like [Frankliniella occidentalis]|uniref:KRAB-A domain-containing protein 2-like n=1 Tax=Frankliniella occidentalis TaxID=133901 RepID=A0A9C6X1N2_FRAOC|nr:KRAB-A domain-containing protein 2-like [Frankliniella occidentalis]